MLHVVNGVDDVIFGQIVGHLVLRGVDCHQGLDCARGLVGRVVRGATAYHQELQAT